MNRHSYGALVTVITVLIGSLALLFAGCDDITGSDKNDAPAADDGTVTVSLSGASDIIGEQHLWVWLYEADEWNIDTPETVLAAGSQQISGGTASFVLKQSDGNFGYTSTTWSGTGGASYDLYIMSASATGEPLETSKITADAPETLTIDGDRTVEVAYSSMVAYQPTTGTLTATLSDAAAKNGKVFALGVWVEGEGPWAHTPIDWDSVVITSGTATVSIEPWTDMEAGMEYGVFMLILMEDRPTGPVPGEDYVYQSTDPVPWYVDGDRTMRPEYEDFIVIPVPE